ncbi:MAG: hypothetical protein JWR16_762 [Nevskia sp.]|nr:hypothetical protein [Nevskia sp.]
MNAVEWALIVGIIAILVGPFLALKAVAKFRSRRRGASEPDKK